MPPKSLQLPSLAALHHFVEECMDRPTDSEGDEPGFGCEFYPRGSSATPSTCPSKCGHCASHYLSYRWQKLDPYAEKLSDDEARATIQKDLQTTDENLEYVHDMLMLYGNGILKRWQKRNVSKRALLLRKAMPEMHQHMWSEARHIPHCRSCKTSKHTAPHRKCWLLPHLSIEELSQDWTKLLALIHVRTTFSPSEWFDFDVNCLENGWHFAFLDVAYNPHCVDVRHENFGQLQQWDAAEAHRGVIVGFPRAQLAFEAQSELSGFLRVMINLLLGSTIDEIASGSDHWQTLATEDFAGDGSGQVARSAYLNQPYCTPCKFDIDRIRDLFQTRYDDAKDELWLLQTNPMHLREQLARAQRSSYYRQLDTIERSTFMIDSALSAVNHLDHATRLSSEVGTLLDILRTYEGQFTIGDALPKDYDDCLRSLYVVLMSQWKLQVEDLYNMVLRVSAFQHHFRRYDDGTVDYKTSPEEAFRSDRLFWNVMKLIERNYNPIHKPAFHFAYVESLLANAPTAEKDNIDYVLYEQLSDLSTIDEALTILRSHRPYMGGPMSKEELDATRAKIGVQEYFESLRHNLGSWHNVEPLVKPLEEFLSLSLPSAKLNETSVSRFSDLHTSMCKFWHEVRLVRVLHLKKSGVPQEKRALSTRNLLEGVAEGYKSALKKELESFRDAVKAKGKLDVLIVSVLN